MDAASHVGQELAGMTAESFDIRTYRYACQESILSSLGRTLSTEMTWRRKSTCAAPIRDVSWERASLWKRNRA